MKVKLRDLTEEQYKKFVKNNCGINDCEDCIFNNVRCSANKIGWINHKDLYSDKFLNQEIEIVTDDLTNEEKDYLKAVIEPYKDKVKTIFKTPSEYYDSDNDFLVIELVEDCIALPIMGEFEFKGLEFEEEYTMKDLGL